MHGRSSTIALAIGCAAVAIVGASAAAPAGGTTAASDIQSFVPMEAAAPVASEALPTLSGDIELVARIGDDGDFRQMLKQAGVAAGDARAAAKAIGDAQTWKPGVAVHLFLNAGSGGTLRLAGARWRPHLGQTHLLMRARDGTMTLVTSETPVDSTPARFSGVAGQGLFWALRKKGVPADAAQEYLAAISTKLNGGSVSSADRFDLIVERRQEAGGATEWGKLVYAALDRQSGKDIRLVRWSLGGRDEWAEPGKDEQRVAGMDVPVSGRLSSGFGYRFHPILGTARLHRGIDIAAPRGTPVVAAEDGTVVLARWNGGYGNQVRIAHAGGLQTSYGHLSQIAAATGHRIRRGQVIGYVGATGLATGPHLHYEALQDGQPVDPTSLRQSSNRILTRSDLDAIGARFRQLLSV